MTNPPPTPSELTEERLAEIEQGVWAVAAHVASHRRDGTRCPNDLDMLNRAVDDLAALLAEIEKLRATVAKYEKDRFWNVRVVEEPFDLTWEE